MIFLSFITPCSTRRNDSAVVAAECANDDDFFFIYEPENHVAVFTFAIRSTDVRRAIDDTPRIFKVDTVITQTTFTFTFIPFERTNVCECTYCNVFRHSE